MLFQNSPPIFRLCRLVATIVLGTVSSVLVWAAPALKLDPTFGVELTAIHESSENHMASEADVENVAKVFADKTDGKLSRDGTFWFVDTALGRWIFHLDSGAAEAASPVLTEESARQTQDLEHVFESFAAVGLHPEIYPDGSYGGGGHIHIGRDIFDRDPILLRNLWVDFANRPWRQTIFEETGDTTAMHPRDMITEPADLIERTIRKIDYVLSMGKVISATDFAEAIPGGHDRGMALNLVNLLKFSNVDADGESIVDLAHPTLEVRFPRAPLNAEHVRTRLHFFKKYLEYLANYPSLVPMRHMKPADVNFERLPSVARARFIEFIKEIDPQNIFKYLAEWNNKYGRPVMKNASGTVELRVASELRSKRSYEIKIKSPDMPFVKARIGTSSISEFSDVPMRPLADAVWLGRVEDFSDQYTDYLNPPRADMINLQVHIGRDKLFDKERSGVYRSCEAALTEPLSS